MRSACPTISTFWYSARPICWASASSAASASALRVALSKSNSVSSESVNGLATTMASRTMTTTSGPCTGAGATSAFTGCGSQLAKRMSCVHSPVCTHSPAEAVTGAPCGVVRYPAASSAARAAVIENQLTSVTTAMLSLYLDICDSFLDRVRSWSDSFRQQAFRFPRAPELRNAALEARASRELVVVVDALLPELLQLRVLLLPADVEAAAVVGISKGVHGGAVLIALDDLARRHLHEVLLPLGTIRGARLEAGLLEQDFGIRGFLAMDGGARGQSEKRDGEVGKSHL